jgi:hypothetical protein
MKQLLAYFAAIILAIFILILGPPIHGLAYILNKFHDWFEEAAEYTSLL